ncbi:MAG: hypothetical protein WBA51_18450 [Erythrobacter sp.]
MNKLPLLVNTLTAFASERPYFGGDILEIHTRDESGISTAS